VRRSLPRFLVLLLPLLLVGCERDWRVGDKDPPNILLIVVDTLRADHLGCYGYQRPTSPQIDTLAGMSTVFDRAYSHSPWTMPSIASILTGLEPRDHGISKWQDPLEQQLVTIAELLRGHGYRTGAAVSHYILKPDYHFDQGFEVYSTGALELGPPHDAITSQQITHMGKKLTLEKRAEPWFVMLHYFDPHAWYRRHPEHDFGPSDMDRYDGEIAYTDRHIGVLLDQMYKREQLRDTLVVLIADHGEAFMDHGHDQHTISLYEEQIRIPFIIYVPGFEARRLDQVVAETQLAPTLLSLAGLPIPPSMRAPPIPFDEDGFLPDEDYKVFAETKRLVNKQAVVDGDWKLHHDRRRRQQELYDLAADPGEENDLHGERSDRVQDLRGQLTEHNRQPRFEVREVSLSDETKRALQALGYLAEDEVDVQAEDAAIDAEERAGLELRPSVIQQMPEPVRP
jgi:arylsulfatase A-like enzyme